MHGSNNLGESLTHACRWSDIKSKWLKCDTFNLYADRRFVQMAFKIANAPCSWGIYEFKELEPKYPYQRVLDEIQETGYAGLEYGPWGYLPSDPVVLNQELAQRGLQLLSSFVPVKLVDAAAHDDGLAHALQVGKVLQAVGAQFLVLSDDNGTVPEAVKMAGRITSPRLSADQWDVFATGVNTIAREVHRQLNLQVVFHHHCAGYVETAEETRQLMQRTDPDLVGLCLDTGHWHYAGGNALDAIKEYGERVRYLHFKDCDPAIRQICIEQELDHFQATGKGVYCELGQGEVDFPGILAAMQQLGYDGWVIVEQDVLVSDMDAPRQSARRNREYLRGLGF
jgi:inosose dehydratase